MYRFPISCLPIVPQVSERLEDIVEHEGTTVLVVEDSPETLGFMTFVLKASGYSVVATRDGLGALCEFERRRPDMVILDLDLPDVSGFRLMQLFRRSGQPSPVPVVVVTGYQYEEAEEVIKEGAADLITKPFELADFMDRLDAALCRSKNGAWLPDVRSAIVTKSDSAPIPAGQDTTFDLRSGTAI